MTIQNHLAVECFVNVSQKDIDYMKKHNTTNNTDAEIARDLALSSIEGRDSVYEILVEKI